MLKNSLSASSSNPDNLLKSLWMSLGIVSLDLYPKSCSISAHACCSIVLICISVFYSLKCSYSDNCILASLSLII